MKPRVMLIDEDQDRRATLERSLVMAGYQILAPMKAGDDLPGQVQAMQPDVIVVDVDAPDRDTLEHMCSIARDMPRPVVMFTHDDDVGKMRAAIHAGVSAYVVGGLSSERVKHIVDVAVLRFEQHQALRDELEKTRTSLADRKLIERAKGILMRTRGHGEDQAYRAMRKMAMDRNQRLVEVAKNVIDVLEILG